MLKTQWLALGKKLVRYVTFLILENCQAQLLSLCHVYPLNQSSFLVFTYLLKS